MKLRHWYAVHSQRELVPSPIAMLEAVQPCIAGLTHRFLDQDGDWREGAFWMENMATPLVLVRRVDLHDESSLWFRDGWEAELGSWPGPNAEAVIEHLRARRQTVTLTPIGINFSPTKLARICEQVCGYLARATDGLIQVYQEGFFNTDGESIFPQNPKHKLKTT